MSRWIKTYQNVVPDEVCQKLMTFFEEHPELHSKERYGPGKNVHCDYIYTTRHCDKYPEPEKIFCDLIDSFIKKHLCEGGDMHACISQKQGAQVESSGYLLRKILGPTRGHSDGPEITQSWDPAQKCWKIYYRILTCIFVFSDGGDELIFPKFNKTIELKKGMVIAFPPYWTYFHYSKFNKESYRCQFWLRIRQSSRAEQRL